jgi:hypothetical protein
MEILGATDEPPLGARVVDLVSSGLEVGHAGMIALA